MSANLSLTDLARMAEDKTLPEHARNAAKFLLKARTQPKATKSSPRALAASPSPSPHVDGLAAKLMAEFSAKQAAREERRNLAARPGLSEYEPLSPEKGLCVFAGHMYALSPNEYAYIRSRAAYGDSATEQALNETALQRLQNSQPPLAKVKL